MSTAVTTFETDWQEWHSARERDLATPHGWLSLTSFHWLPEAPTQLEGLPGRFSVVDGQAVLEASVEDGYRVRENRLPVDGIVRAQVAEARSLEWLIRGDVVVELALRGGRYAIRTRDPQAPALVHFGGVPAFDRDEKWILEGTFTPFDVPRTIEVGTARPDLVQYLSAVGAVTVSVDGQEVELLAAAGGAGTLNIAFHDATNGTLTAPWRAVGVTAPDAAGRVRIDFNRAVNFPFAFSDFGTCPAPAAGNLLPVAVTAGELAPGGVAR